MGIFTGFHLSLLILGATTALFMIAYSSRSHAGGPLKGFFQGGTYDESGIAELDLGGHDAWLNATSLHALINIFSTLLLSASTHTAQVLTATTRVQLDEVHVKGFL